MKRIVVLIISILSVCFLWGCTPGNYTKDAQKEVLNIGKPLLENYLSSHYEDYTLETISVTEGMIASSCDSYDNGRNLTNLVSAQYKRNGESQRLYVDISTGDFYTTDYSLDIDHAFHELFGDLFGDFLENNENSFSLPNPYVVTALNTTLTILSENIPTKDGNLINTYAELRNVLPAALTDDTLPDYLAESIKNNSGKFYLTVFTNSTADIPTPELWFDFHDRYPAFQSIFINITNEASLVADCSVPGDVPQSNRSVPGEAYICQSGLYMLSETYHYIELSRKQHEDVLVLSPDRSVSYYADAMPQEQTYSTTFTVEGDLLTIESDCNLTSSYILFQGDKDYENAVIYLPNTMLTEDPDPFCYNYRIYAENYYTIDGMSGPTPYSFTRKIILSNTGSEGHE